MLKAALEILPTIRTIDVTRSGADYVGGYTWTISFLDDATRAHQGDMPDFSFISALICDSGSPPSIIVSEVRKGTIKEIQRISTSAGSSFVDPASSFKLSFRGESTNAILALPAEGTTCLGSTAARQIITTTTEDTSGEGGDDTISPLTNFTISYDDYSTSFIKANSGTCAERAVIITNELMQLPPLNNVFVTGNDTDIENEGCTWIVTLLSITGNPELFQGKIC